MELVDLEAARMEALAALGEIAKDQLRNGDQRDFVIDIRRRSRCSEGFTFTPSRTECLANQQQPTDRSGGGKPGSFPHAATVSGLRFFGLRQGVAVANQIRT
jgi:Domain of unknown function (DUF6894)